MTPRTSRYLRDYGLGMALVAAIVSLVGFSLAYGTHSFEIGQSVVCLIVYLVAVGGVIRRTWLGARWRWAAAIWLVALVAATAAVRGALSVDQLAGPADWTFGAFGYVAVVVLAGQRLALTAGALTFNLVIALPALIGAYPNDEGLILSLAQTAIGVTIFPLAAALFYPRLAAVARTAQEQALARQELLSQEARAVRLAADRTARGAAIARTVVPLLAALADGSADPQDPALQRAARIESARLRRMFAEVDDAEQPLLHEIRASMAAAERSGVAAILDVRGTLPELPVDARRDLLDAPMSLLANARSRAKIVLIGSPQSVSVSVAADSADVDPRAGGSSVATSSATTGSATWTQSTWEATP